MLRIQKSCTTRTTALLLVFHWHIFLHSSQEPTAVRQREGRKLQKFPFSAGKTVSKSHRGWRLLSLPTFHGCKEERRFPEENAATPQGQGLLLVLFPLAATAGEALTSLFGPRRPRSGDDWRSEGEVFCRPGCLISSQTCTAVIFTSPRLSTTTLTHLTHPSKARQGVGWKNLYLHTKFCFCSCP